MTRLMAQLITGDWVLLSQTSGEQSAQSIAADWEDAILRDQPDRFISVGGSNSGSPAYGQPWDRFRLSAIVRIQTVTD